MSINSRGLGRGLDALFQSSNPAESFSQSAGETTLMLLSPHVLMPNPNQPRQQFSDESLQELASSIRTQGILQPLLARPAGEGTYQIIAGERRWRAAQLANIQQVPVLVREIGDKDAMIIAMIENLQRENLNPMEQAKGLQSLKESLGSSQEELAEIIGQSRSSIANSLRLLKLPAAAQDDLVNGRISFGHAKALLAVPDGELSDKLRLRILETGMTVREAEEAASFWGREGRFPWENDENSQARSKPEGFGQDENIRKLARDIGATLNCRTKITGTPEKGRISLSYDSNSQLFDLLEKLGLSLTP